MMTTLITAQGTVDIDLSKYPHIEAIWSTAAIARATPVEIPCPTEDPMAGSLNFDVQSPREFFEKMHRNLERQVPGDL